MFSRPSQDPIPPGSRKAAAQVARSRRAAGAPDAEAYLRAALARRRRLLRDPHTTACRLFHGAADGLPGFILEKLGDVLVVQQLEGHLKLSEEALRGLCTTAAEKLGSRAVYRKVFPRDRSRALARLEQAHRDPVPWVGTPVEPEITVLEHGLRFRVRPYDGYATGLYLEHRDNRRRVRALARGRRVLNAFAYTCGFTVAAALGGAAETVSVDVSRKALAWGRRNLEANGLPAEPHAFVCADVFDYLRRARRRGRTFGLIILDPPTFARTKRPRRVFSLAADLDRLVHAALAALAADGVLLLCANHRGTPRRRLEASVRAAAEAAGRTAHILARPHLPVDFRGDPGFTTSILIRVG